MRLLGVLGRSTSLEAEAVSQRIQELQARKQELLRQQAVLKNVSAHPHDLEAIVTAAALTLTLLSGMLGGKATSGWGGGDSGLGLVGRRLLPLNPRDAQVLLAPFAGAPTGCVRRGQHEEVVHVVHSLRAESSPPGRKGEESLSGARAPCMAQSREVTLPSLGR